MYLEKQPHLDVAVMTLAIGETSCPGLVGQCDSALVAQCKPTDSGAGVTQSPPSQPHPLAPVYRVSKDLWKPGWAKPIVPLLHPNMPNLPQPESPAFSKEVCVRVCGDVNICWSRSSTCWRHETAVGLSNKVGLSCTSLLGAYLYRKLKI